MRHEELKATTQKSYYKKAYVLKDGENLYLQSYNTIVCGLVEGKFVRYWDGYSLTTMNHVNDFRIQHGLNRLCKKDWDKIPVIADSISYRDHIKANMGNQYYGMY